MTWSNRKSAESCDKVNFSYSRIDWYSNWWPCATLEGKSQSESLSRRHPTQSPYVSKLPLGATISFRSYAANLLWTFHSKWIWCMTLASFLGLRVYRLWLEAGTFHLSSWFQCHFGPSAALLSSRVLPLARVIVVSVRLPIRSRFLDQVRSVRVGACSQEQLEYLLITTSYYQRKLGSFEIGIGATV